MWDSVYSAAQAERGKDIYAQQCSGCHGDFLDGDGASGRVVALSGDAFADNWESASLNDLFVKIGRTMPRGAPGTLSSRQTLELMAFLLQYNGFPAGTGELAETPELALVDIVGKDGPRPLRPGSGVRAVGCLTADGDAWTLTRASAPVRTRTATVSTGPDVDRARTTPLGTRTIRLANAKPGSDVRAGAKVEARGALSADDAIADHVVAGGGPGVQPMTAARTPRPVRLRDRRVPRPWGAHPKRRRQPARRSLVFWILPVQAPVSSATLAKAFSTALPDVDVQFVERERGADYGAALQKGEVDVTIMFADTAYLAFVGQLGGEPYDRLRGIATLNPNPLYLLVRRGSAIRQLADLQGRRVGVGRPGASIALTAKVVLETFHLDVEESDAAVGDALAALAAGELDALFVGGVSAGDQVRAALAGNAEVLPFSPETIARLQRRHPFMRGMVIPRDLARGAPGLTIGLDGLLVCRSGLDADIVYGVTKAFFQALPDLSAFDTPPLRQMNPEDASATPIPLHEGAARYYREQGTM